MWFYFQHMQPNLFQKISDFFWSIKIISCLSESNQQKFSSPINNNCSKFYNKLFIIIQNISNGPYFHGPNYFFFNFTSKLLIIINFSANSNIYRENKKVHLKSYARVLKLKITWPTDGGSINVLWSFKRADIM